MKEKLLGLRIKLGFGVCDLGGNLFFTMMGFHLLFFLTDVTGLRAGLAGTALMIGKIWDAVTDPAVGVLSDRTRHRWGRRRPYIFYGAILLFATMILMFLNPGIPGQGLLFVWAAFAYCLLNTAYTLVNIPYSALLPELTADFNQRTVLTAYRMSFAVVGTFIGAGAIRPLAGSFASVNTGWTVMAAAMGAIMMITALATFFAIREPSEQPPVVREKVFRSFLDAMKTRAFLLSVFPWLLHVTGTSIIQGALVYYFRYIYGADSQFEIALLFLLGSVFVFIPVWAFISRKIGKKLSYNIGMLVFAVVVIVFFLFAPRLGLTFSYVIMALAGIGFATHYVMPHAILPDVVEYDYAETGVRREGIFYGLWTFGSKVGQALALGLNGWILAAFGYAADVDQTALAKLGIRLLVGPIPAVFFVAGIIVLSYYPINRKAYARIIEKIASRAQDHGPDES